MTNDDRLSPDRLLLLGRGDPRPPRPVADRPAPSAKRGEWLRAAAIYAAGDWRRQRDWWREHRSPELSLEAEPDAEGILSACGHCWLLALRYRLGNAHELRRVMRALEDMRDYQACDRMLDEAELAVDGLEYAARLWSDDYEAAITGIQELRQLRRPNIDVGHDVVCEDIRSKLGSGPLILEELVGRVSASRTTVVRRLRVMRQAGEVEQTAPRGPWRLVESASPRRD